LGSFCALSHTIVGDQAVVTYVEAMYPGGRLVEITMTTPGALERFEAINYELKGEMLVAAWTVRDYTPDCDKIEIVGRANQEA
jgi:2-keto-3-deoxy-6-phosphogluconate aldolase